MFAQHLKLCLVTHFANKSFHAYKDFLLQAVQGGVTAVQLRAKNADATEIRQWGLALKAILQPLKIPLLINDHVDIAVEIAADGVHLGQADLSPSAARHLLGADKIIGWSVETAEELAAANQLACIDYIAASAVFPSKTKLDCQTIWGLEGLRNLVQQSKHPVMAIGGIDLSNVAQVMSTGACGVAVVSALHEHPYSYKAASDLINKITGVHDV
jgi:thiamine-phosphate pyrophosphorylase